MVDRLDQGRQPLAAFLGLRRRLELERLGGCSLERRLAQRHLPFFAGLPAFQHGIDGRQRLGEAAQGPETEPVAVAEIGETEEEVRQFGGRDRPVLLDRFMQDRGNLRKHRVIARQGWPGREGTGLERARAVHRNRRARNARGRVSERALDEYRLLDGVAAGSRQRRRHHGIGEDRRAPVVGAQAKQNRREVGIGRQDDELVEGRGMVEGVDDVDRHVDVGAALAASG